MKKLYLVLLFVSLELGVLSAQVHLSWIEGFDGSIAGTVGWGSAVVEQGDGTLSIGGLRGVEQISSVAPKQHMSYHMGLKGYGKLSKSIKVGLGVKFEKREFVTNFYGDDYGPILLLQYDGSATYLGPSISIAYEIPKWRTSCFVSSSLLFQVPRRADVKNINFSVLFPTGDFYLITDKNPNIHRVYSLGGGFKVRLTKGWYATVEYAYIGRAHFITMIHEKIWTTSNGETIRDLVYSSSVRSAPHQVSVGISYLFGRHKK